MFALILRHNVSMGKTANGILILHTTQQPVLVADTPLSQVLLNHFVQGFRFFVYDRTVHKRREKIIPPKNLEKFIAASPIFYAHSRMTLEQITYKLNDTRTIDVDNITYTLKEIK